MFSRALLTFAVITGIAHVFRRDLKRVVGVLKKPTETFVKELKNEIEASKAAGATGEATSEVQKTITDGKLQAGFTAAEKLREETKKSESTSESKDPKTMQ